MIATATFAYHARFSVLRNVLERATAHKLSSRHSHLARMPPFGSSDDEDYSGEESDDLSEEVRCPMHVASGGAPLGRACSQRRFSNLLDTLLQELAAALELQQQRAARGGAASGPAAGSQDEDEDEEEGPGAGPGPRPAIYNVDAIHDKLEDVGWSEEQPWEEAMALTSTQPVAVANTEDDLERELAFYNQVGRYWNGTAHSRHDGQ